MGDIKKLCIRKFDSVTEVESFYNDFSEKNQIISKEIQIITREKSNATFLLILEYFE